MAISGEQLVLATQDAPSEKPLATTARRPCFGCDMQPTTIMMLVAIMMIFYSRVAGG